MKVDIIFLVSHFQKVGEDIFPFFIILLLFLCILKKVIMRVHVMQKAPTPYEIDTDHLILQGNFLERLAF